MGHLETRQIAVNIWKKVTVNKPVQLKHCDENEKKPF